MISVEPGLQRNDIPLVELGPSTSTVVAWSFWNLKDSLSKR